MSWILASCPCNIEIIEGPSNGWALHTKKMGKAPTAPRIDAHKQQAHSMLAKYRPHSKILFYCTQIVNKNTHRIHNDRRLRLQLGVDICRLPLSKYFISRSDL